MACAPGVLSDAILHAIYGRLRAPRTDSKIGPFSDSGTAASADVLRVTARRSIHGIPPAFWHGTAKHRLQFTKYHTEILLFIDVR